MEKLIAHPEIMDNYLRRVLELRNRLQAKGFRLNETPSYITSILIGNDEKAVHVQRAFLEHGFIVPMFRYPAVKPDHALIRILLNAQHTDEQLEQFIDLLEQLKLKYDF